MTDGWIILRCSGPRTLKLAASLNEGGVEAWTPAQTVVGRKGKARDRVEQQVTILPTFVFARASRLEHLFRARLLPVCPYPSFSIFRHDGRVPVLSDHDIAALHANEEAEAERWRVRQQEEMRKAEHERLRDQERAMAQQAHVERERQRTLRRALKATAPSYRPGTKVTVPRAEFAGMSGEVIKIMGRAALVSFGGGLLMKIDSWLLVPDDVRAPAIAA